MKEECRNCKSFKPTVYPLHCGDPNRETIMDGICQKDQRRHDADDFCDDFEQASEESQQSNDFSQ
jgi:hypothetical protein